jgi:phosphoribosylamine--glycine ligase
MAASAIAEGSMRVLGIGDYADLGDLYLDLVTSGHEVRMYVEEPAYHGVFAGMVERVDDWRAELDWIRGAGKDGIIVFETARHGELQDRLRNDGFQVIGGCAWGDRLEGDRAFGQEVMRRIGMRTAPVRHFTDFMTAMAFIRENPGRYVYKHNGHHLPSTHNYVGVLPDGSDVIALLHSYRHGWPSGTAPDFILMDHLDGIETGVGAYFDGRSFIGPACLDWEHKRFFPGDLGELTGEMGTVVTYQDSARLFAETLAPMAPLLAAAGYCGYINLNTIINQQGIWPLEFTCRFGYPGFAILAALHPGGWTKVLKAMTGGGGFSTDRGYAVGVVLTVPPFPYLPEFDRLSRGMPILFRGGLSDAERRNLHYGEVGLVDGQPVVSGASGYVLVATGRGSGVSAARRAAYGLLDRVVVPNGRYRHDIGLRFLRHDARELARLGYLSPPIEDQPGSG